MSLAKQANYLIIARRNDGLLSLTIRSNALALFGFLKPKWKNADPAVRKSAVADLRDPSLLGEIALSDEDWDVRRTAVRRLDDRDVLLKVALRDKALDTALAALERLRDEDSLARVAKKARKGKVRIEAAVRLGRQSVFADLATNDPVASVREKAVAQLGDSQILEEVIAGTEDSQLETAARHRLTAVLADSGDPQAQFALANRHLDRSGVDFDRAKAAEWFRRAAGQGHREAIQQLGRLYLYGDGVEKDEKEALRLFAEAANSGDAEAANFIGVMYYFGKGVEENARLAADWFRKSIEFGYEKANFNLATLYLEGRGVDVDEVTAAQMMRRAADTGLAEAQLGLADLLLQGRGIAADKDAARGWFRKAAEQGSVEARGKLTTLELEAAKSAARLETFRHREQRFALDHPLGWQPDFFGEGLQLRPAEAEFVYEMDFPVFDPCLNLLIGQRPGAQKDGQKLFQQFIDANAKNFYLFELLWQEPFDLFTGQEAIEYAFKFNLHLTWLQVNALVTARRDQLISLSLIGSPKTIEKMGKTARVIVRSLALD